MGGGVVAEERLLELNRLTFLAETRPIEPIEGKPWQEFLGATLGESFEGRRGNPALPHQDREMFIDFATTASDAVRNVVGEPTVTVVSDLGVVTSDVRLDDDDTKRFRNVKVFRREDGNWRCIYWQVTPFDTGS